MVHDRIDDILIEKGGEFTHGFTYSEHPDSFTLTIENLKIIETEQSIENVDKETGPYLEQRWHEFSDHPLVGEVRNAGLLASLELVANKKLRNDFLTQEKSVFSAEAFVSRWV